VPSGPARLRPAGRPVDRRLASLGVIAGIGGGLLGALQSRVNGDLAERLDSAQLAALVSFGGGFGILAGVVLGYGRLRRAIRPALSVRLPW
jgi:uncharacterized membrane protein YdcZ (DUF606 family)